MCRRDWRVDFWVLFLVQHLGYGLVASRQWCQKGPFEWCRK